MQFIVWKKNAAIKHAVCATHHNDCHKKLRARDIPSATSEREAYVEWNHSEHQGYRPHLHLHSTFSHQPPIITLIGPLFNVCFYCTLHSVMMQCKRKATVLDFGGGCWRKMWFKRVSLCLWFQALPEVFKWLLLVLYIYQEPHFICCYDFTSIQCCVSAPMSSHH